MQLIDRGRAYLALKHEAEAHMLPEYREAYERAARIIGQMEPVDAEPVRHGSWEFPDRNPHFKYCSECDGANFGYNFTYCPHCGAKMDGGESNATD